MPEINFNREIENFAVSEIIMKRATIKKINKEFQEFRSVDGKITKILDIKRSYIVVYGNEYEIIVNNPSLTFLKFCGAFVVVAD